MASFEGWEKSHYFKYMNVERHNSSTGEAQVPLGLRRALLW